MEDMNMNKDIRRYFEQDKKLLVKVITGIIFLVIAFSFYLMKDKAEDDPMTVSSIPESGAENMEKAEEESAEAKEIVIMIDVSGAVAQPSVVSLPEGSRIFEAVEKAGGFTAEADTRVINQAEILTDGQKLYIPTKQEVEESLSGVSSPNLSGVSSASVPGVPSANPSYQTGASQSGLININTADSETLQQLSGVGPATAEKIIDYRNKNGKFKTIEDIKNVSGIGEKTFEKFRDKITV